MTTTHRGYFQPVAGIPPTEHDLNAGFIDKVDADVTTALGRLADLEAAQAALKVRVDAVITDAEGGSVLKVALPEFIPFSAGTAALSPGNAPQRISNTKFRVNGNWLTVFTAGRRLVSVPITTYSYVVSSVPFGNQTEVTVVMPASAVTSLPTMFSDVGVGVLQYGMPRLSLDQIPDDFIPPEKLTDPPALASDLTTAVAGFTGTLNSVNVTQTSITANLATHAGLSSGVHGVAPGSTIETVVGATAKVAAHNADGAAHAALLAGLQLRSQKGALNGYAELVGGKIPAGQLPLMGLKFVYRGETGMTDGGSAAQSFGTTSFPAVNPAKAFIIISVRGLGSAPKTFKVTAEFTAGNTSLTLKREESNGVISVVWQVVEFY